MVSKAPQKNIPKLKQILLNNYIEHMHKELCVPKWTPKKIFVNLLY